LDDVIQDFENSGGYHPQRASELPLGRVSQDERNLCYHKLIKRWNSSYWPNTGCSHSPAALRL